MSDICFACLLATAAPARACLMGICVGLIEGEKVAHGVAANIPLCPSHKDEMAELQKLAQWSIDVANKVTSE